MQCLLEQWFETISAILGDFPNEALKRQEWDQKIHTLLKVTDLLHGYDSIMGVGLWRCCFGNYLQGALPPVESVLHSLAVASNFRRTLAASADILALVVALLAHSMLCHFFLLLLMFCFSQCTFGPGHVSATRINILFIFLLDFNVLIPFPTPVTFCFR